MNNEVDFTFGFNCSMVETGTPDFEEMTPKVSPARTVQNLRADVAAVGRLPVVVGDATVLCGGAGAPELVPEPDVPDCRPERMSRTAIVAASRNAAGAM